MLLLASCNKLNITNFDQLETGMKYNKVTDIIGSPDSCNETLGTRTCIWGEPKGTFIKASFINEAAIFFSHGKLK